MTGVEGHEAGEAELAAAEDQAAIEAAREAAPTSPVSHRKVGPGTRDAVIQAEHVDFSQGGASRVQARTVTLSQGGAGRISAHDVSISQGGAGIVQAGTLRLESDASALLVVARNAEVAPGSRVFLLISGRTSGATRPLLDPRSALAMAGGFLIFRRLLGLLRRR